MAVKKSKAVKKTAKALPPARRKRSDAALVTRDRATKATSAAIRKLTINAALDAADDLANVMTHALAETIKGNLDVKSADFGGAILAVIEKAGAARSAVLSARKYV